MISRPHSPAYIIAGSERQPAQPIIPELTSKQYNLLILKIKNHIRFKSVIYVIKCTFLSVFTHTTMVISNTENVILQNYKRAAGVQEHYCETSARFDELETKSIPLLADGKRVSALRHAGRRLYYTQHIMITSESKKERERERER